MWYNRGMKNQNYRDPVKWLWLCIVAMVMIILVVGVGTYIHIQPPIRSILGHGFTSGEVTGKGIVQDKYPVVYVSFLHPVTNQPEVRPLNTGFKEMMLLAIDQKITLEWWFFKDGDKVLFEIKIVSEVASEARFLSRNTEKGIGSWYGKYFHGRTMANGRRFNMHAVTVAHKTLPLGTRVRVINLINNRWIEARVTDRGPYKPGRIVDMSYGAAKILGMVHHGIVPVVVIKI